MKCFKLYSFSFFQETVIFHHRKSVGFYKTQNSKNHSNLMNFLVLTATVGVRDGGIVIVEKKHFYRKLCRKCLPNISYETMILFQLAKHHSPQPEKQETFIIALPCDRNGEHEKCFILAPFFFTLIHRLKRRTRLSIQQLFSMRIAV